MSIAESVRPRLSANIARLPDRASEVAATLVLRCAGDALGRGRDSNSGGGYGPCSVGDFTFDILVTAAAAWQLHFFQPKIINSFYELFKSFQLHGLIEVAIRVEFDNL